MVEFPKYSIYYEFLFLIKNKREAEIWVGNTEKVPMNLREELFRFYLKCKNDSLIKIVHGFIRFTKELNIRCKEYKDGFNNRYDCLQQYTYNLVVNNRDIDAIKLYSEFKLTYPFLKSGFFIDFTSSEVLAKAEKINKSSVFNRIGFKEPYVNSFKAIMKASYLFGDVNLEDKFNEVMPGSMDIIKNSPLIKNNNLPFFDIKKIIEGEKVVKL